MRLVTFPHIVLLTTCNNNLAQVCGVFEREIRRMQFLTPTFWRLARGLFCHRLLNLVQNPSPPTRRRFSEHVAASLTSGRNHQCIFNPVASTAKQLTRPIFSRFCGGQLAHLETPTRASLTLEIHSSMCSFCVSSRRPTYCQRRTSSNMQYRKRNFFSTCSYC